MAIQIIFTVIHCGFAGAVSQLDLWQMKLLSVCVVNDQERSGGGMSTVPAW